MTADGGLLDRAGIRLNPGVSWASTPAIASDGANYLIAWWDLEGISALRVDRDGAALDPQAFSVTPSSGDFPRIAFNGEVYLVVWNRYWDESVWGTRVSPAGIVLDPGGVLISSPGSRFPDVASDGAGFLVAWTDERTGGADIYAARVTGAGAVIDTAGFPVAASGEAEAMPRLAHDGSQYLAVWQVGAGSGPYATAAARVTPAGVVLDPAGIPLGAGDQHSVSFDGSTWLVALHRDGQAYAIRVDATGAVLDPSGIPLSSYTPAYYPVLSCGAPGCLSAWSDQRFGREDIIGTRVGTGGMVLDPDGILLSHAASTQRLGDAAAGGTDRFVVWQESLWGDADLVGARLDATGSPLDPDGIVVSAAPGQQDSPVVAFDGSNYLVVWQDWRLGSNEDIFAARVALDGTVLDPAGIAVSIAAGPQRLPRVASAGDGWLVVWMGGFWTSWDPPSVHAARVAADGTVLDPSGIPLFADAAHPSVAFTGTSYYVAYVSTAGPLVTRGARVGLDGVLMDTGGAFGVGSYVGSLALACSTTDCLLAHPDSSGFAGRLFDPADSAITGGFNVVGAGPPAVSFDGTRYVVVWTEGFDFDIALGSARYEPAADLLVPGPRVAHAEDEYLAASVVATSSDRALVIYDYMNLTYGSTRVFGRLVTWSLIGEPCTIDGECRDRHCVDGVCCEDACGGGDATDCLVCNAPGSVGSCVTAPAGTECRQAVGPCDVAEVCDGGGTTCPADAVLPNGTLCRVAAGDCDVDDHCFGTGPWCAEHFLPTGTPCTADDNPCTRDACTGYAADCSHPAGNAGSECRPAAGECDVAEACTGTSTDCPPDVLLPATALCREAAGDCDVAEHCTGSLSVCPPDDLLPSTWMCRPAAGVCDAAEHCTGAAPGCPEDAFVPPPVECRAKVTPCDVPEECPGDGPDCPADLRAPDGSPCSLTDVCLTGGACAAGDCIGGTPALAASPPALAFVPGGPPQAVLVLDYAGDQPGATLDAVEIEPAASVLLDGPTLPAPLTAGTGVSLTVGFSPPWWGAFEGTLTFRATGCDALLVPLHGEASMPDAGTPDASTPDAGAPDAGIPDAGTPDASTPDAGAPDAHAPPDSTTAPADAMAVPHDAGDEPPGGGCSCRTTRGAPPGAAVWFVLLVGASLLRRRARSRGRRR